MTRPLSKFLNGHFMRFGRWFVTGLDDFYAQKSTLGNSPFFELKYFPWATELESHTQAIQEELAPLIAERHALPNFQDISADQRYLTQDDGWKTVFLYAYGLPSPSAKRHFPNTVGALKKIPGMKTAMFSIFSPHKSIPPHRGPLKGVLRYHLALKVPSQKELCGLRVENKKRQWTEGKGLIFDDTFEHEAWNHSDEVRVVLFVDFLRPLKFPYGILNRIIVWLIALSPFVLGSIPAQLRWEKRFFGKSKVSPR